MSSKNIAHHIIKYRNVFIILLVCTDLTVLASGINFNVENSIAGGIFVGLTIASPGTQSLYITLLGVINLCLGGFVAYLLLTQKPRVRDSRKKFK